MDPLLFYCLWFLCIYKVARSFYYLATVKDTFLSYIKLSFNKESNVFKKTKKIKCLGRDHRIFVDLISLTKTFFQITIPSRIAELMTCLIICFGLKYKPNHFMFCSVYAIKHFDGWMLTGKLSGNISLKKSKVFIVCRWILLELLWLWCDSLLLTSFSGSSRTVKWIQKLPCY